MTQENGKEIITICPICGTGEHIEKRYDEWGLPLWKCNGCGLKTSY